MKKYIFYLLTAALLFTLAACGETMDLNTPPDSKAELAQCQALLEDFQSRNSYQLHKSSRYDSYIILNPTSESDYWRHGEDWMHLHRPLPEEPSEGIFAYLGKDDRIFSTERGGFSWEGDIQWGAHDDWPWYQDPWLVTFRWAENEIAYASTAVMDNQKVITLVVTTPWVASADNPDLGIADEYTLAFHINAKGGLEQIVVDVTFEDNRGAKVTDEHTVYTVVTTDEAKVAAKIDREYQRALEQEAQKHAPDVLPTGSFMSNDGSVEFTWALPDQEMAMEELPTVEAKARLMTGEDAKRIAKVLLGDAQFFDLGGERQLSRQELEKKIAIMERYKSQEALDKLWGTDDSDANIQIHRQSLAVYRNLLETAPGESNLQPCDWTLKTKSGGHYDNMYADTLWAITNVDGIDYSLKLSVDRAEDGRWINSLVVGMGDEDPVSYTPAMYQRSQLCSTREPTQEDYAACLSKAQNWLNEMGMGEYEVLPSLTYVDPAYFNDGERFEIYVKAVPVIEGHPALYGQTGADFYGPTEIHFSFNADAELIAFSLHDPVELGEYRYTAENYQVAELMEIGKQWLMCRSAEDLDAHGNLMMKRLENNVDVTAKVTITQLVYGPAPREWGEVWNLRFFPSLQFKGTVDYFDRETGEYLTGSGDPYGPREQSLLVLNAERGCEIGE